MNNNCHVSILLPTIDETTSLEQTIEYLFSCEVPLCELLLIVADRTTPETLAVCNRFQNKYPDTIRIVLQQLPQMGGAFRTGISIARGTHIILMFADLECEPQLLPSMVFEANKDPDAVISASRWLGEGGFEDYPPLKKAMNLVFQRLCAWTFHSSITDFTHGFRLYPEWVLRRTSWIEAGHAFVLEALLFPLIFAVRIKELPTIQRARKEGKRQSRFVAYSRYPFTAARIWFTAFLLHRAPYVSRHEVWIPRPHSLEVR